ncbi:MAG: hypothetical protein IJV06_06475 [Bacteroidaceae bacterium]|nr:hypothetical protein [Bacteroidaceae bacterium]
MKKIYSLILFAAAGLSAYAEGDGNYYWFYNQVEAAPTGKGVIYASDGNTTPETADDYTSSMEVKFESQGFNTGSLYVWAQPAAGYQFAGWFTSATDETTMAECVATDETAAISVATEQMTEDETVEGYGFEPDATYYGIFTKAKVQYVPGQSSVGLLDISKVANDTGDAVTITATPIDETVKFDYWTDTQGNKIADNPYSFTVSGIETYTAHFSGDSIITFDFGEEGTTFIPFSSAYSGVMAQGMTGYKVVPVEKIFYDENYNQISFDESEGNWGYWAYEYDDEGNVTSSNFVKYEGEIPSFDASYKLDTYGYNYTATDGTILTGKGEMSIVLYADEEATPWGNYIVGTADAPVDIASLPSTDLDGNAITYYTFDGKDFVKATSGTVAQGECYLALDATQYPLANKIAIAPSKVKGDIDGDGIVTVSDITRLIEIYLTQGSEE